MLRRSSVVSMPGKELIYCRRHSARALFDISVAATTSRKFCLSCRRV